MGGKAGAVAVKLAKGFDETSATTTDGGGAVAPPEVTSSTTNPMVTKMEAVLMVPPRLTKPPSYCMKPHSCWRRFEFLWIPNWRRCSWATSRLWMTSTSCWTAEPHMLCVLPGTQKLAEPSAQVSWIIPMGGLSDLDFSLEWRDGLCKLRDDEGREIRVELRHGCPVISKQEGEKILQWLELSMCPNVESRQLSKRCWLMQAWLISAVWTWRLPWRWRWSKSSLDFLIISWWSWSRTWRWWEPKILEPDCRGTDTSGEGFSVQRGSSCTSSLALTPSTGRSNVPLQILRSCALTLGDLIQRTCTTRTCMASCWLCVLQAVSGPS